MTRRRSLCENVFGTITRPRRPVGNVFGTVTRPRSLCENVLGASSPPRSLCEDVFGTITRPRKAGANVLDASARRRSLCENVLDASPRRRNRFGTFPPALRGVETFSGAFALVFARRVGFANAPLVARGSPERASFLAPPSLRSEAELERGVGGVRSRIVAKSWRDHAVLTGVDLYVHDVGGFFGLTPSSASFSSGRRTSSERRTPAMAAIHDSTFSIATPPTSAGPSSRSAMA